MDGCVTKKLKENIISSLADAIKSLGIYVSKANKETSAF